MTAEEEGDAKAAAEARAEQVAELAEFDEAYSAHNDGSQVPWDPLPYSVTRMHMVKVIVSKIKI